MQTIPTRRLGKTDLHLTELSLGGAHVGVWRGGSDDLGVAAVERAYDLGIRHVDTAPLYGPSERRIGMALRKREFPGLTISTKAGTHPERPHSYTAEDLRWSVDNSLRLLGLESVDLLFVHDVPDIAIALKPGDGFDAVDRLRDEGKTRYVGLGVRDHATIHAAIDAGRVDAIITWADYNLVRRTAVPLIERARNDGVGVILGSPAMGGMLAGGDPAVEVRSHGVQSEFTSDDVRIGHEWWLWCREHDVDLAHLNLRFVMAYDKIDAVLTGAATPEEMDQNVRAAYAPIPHDVWRAALTRIAELDDRS